MDNNNNQVVELKYNMLLNVILKGAKLSVYNKKIEFDDYRIRIALDMLEPEKIMSVEDTLLDIQERKEQEEAKEKERKASGQDDLPVENIIF